MFRSWLLCAVLVAGAIAQSKDPKDPKKETRFFGGGGGIGGGGALGGGGGFGGVDEFGDYGDFGGGHGGIGGPFAAGGANGASVLPGLIGGGGFGGGVGGGGFGQGGCKNFCKKYGKYTCCDDSVGGVGGGSGSFVKKGTCPPVRPSCPRFRNPQICEYDDECGGIDKCCFDKCLNEKVCKPPHPDTEY